MIDYPYLCNRIRTGQKEYVREEITDGDVAVLEDHGGSGRDIAVPEPDERKGAAPWLSVVLLVPVGFVGYFLTGNEA